MTLTYKLDQKLHVQTKNNLLVQGFQKLQHHRQTDTQADMTKSITMLHSRVKLTMIIITTVLDEVILGQCNGACRVCDANDDYE